MSLTFTVQDPELLDPTAATPSLPYQTRRRPAPHDANIFPRDDTLKKQLMVLISVGVPAEGVGEGDGKTEDGGGKEAGD